MDALPSTGTRVIRAPVSHWHRVDGLPYSPLYPWRWDALHHTVTRIMGCPTFHCNQVMWFPTDEMPDLSLLPGWWDAFPHTANYCDGMPASLYYQGDGMPYLPQWPVWCICPTSHCNQSGGIPYWPLQPGWCNAPPPTVTRMGCPTSQCNQDDVLPYLLL